MNKKEIGKILKENKELFESLENYDNTRELPFQRKKIYLTLSLKLINRLKKEKKETGKPISRIIEEKFLPGVGKEKY